MRSKPPEWIEEHRVRRGKWGSKTSDGNNGMFWVPMLNSTAKLRVIVSDGTGWDQERMGGTVWERVSASYPNRYPTWPEMSAVKDWFWEPEEWVVQFHPAERVHVNQHPYTLHLWRPIGIEIPTPPVVTGGPLHGS